MRRVALLATFAVLLPVAAVAAPATRTYTVSVDHHTVNEASFTSRAAIVRMTGRTNKLSGAAKINLNDLAHASGSVSVDLTSLDTGIEMRNGHMRNYLETDKFPEATYSFTGIKVPGNKLAPGQLTDGTATGSIKIHGVTKPLNAPMELTFIPQSDPKYREGDWMHFYSQFKIKISDFGINLPAPVLGPKVSNDLTIEIDGMAKGE